MVEKKEKEEKENASQNIEYIEEESEKSFDVEKKIKRLKEELKHCQKEKEEYLAGWQRAKADFINYKKEEQIRIKEGVLFEKKKILLEIISLLDNLERAEENLSDDLKGNVWVEGILKIKDQIKSFLEKEGVKEIKVEKDFNPVFCEAVQMGDGADGEVIEVLQKGYLFNDSVLRPAKVKVGKGREN